MQRMNPSIRILLCALVLCLCLPILSACGAPEGTVDAQTLVGSVDGVDVCYDELYFLVQGYRDTVREATDGDPAKMQTELDRIVKEQIVANAAILKLCEQKELDYPERECEQDAEAELELLITSDFEGDKKAYREGLAQVGLTERYLLYTTEVDLMYGRLMTLYPQKGLVSDDPAEIRTYIQRNFIRTVHIMNPDPDEIALAYRELTEGKKTMDKLIGSVYNKDFNDSSGNGYYFAKGTMDEAYEQAAFALAPNEISGIIKATGEIEDRMEPCYYIIQRLELDEDYITKNLSTLQDQYYAGVIYADMEAIRKTLIFAPNEFYTTLDLTELAPPHEASDLSWILPTVCISLVVIVLAVTLPLVLLKRKHAKKNISRRAS